MFAFQRNFNRNGALREFARMHADGQRRFPIGAELTPQGVSFRVWAPRRKSVVVVLESASGPQDLPLESEGNGYFSGIGKTVRAGDRYRFRLDKDDLLIPDPASRFQPEGPHGPSQVIDPAYKWTDADWPGIRLEGQILYEMHVGTFSRAGTWAGAESQLADLADVGITCIEVMPVSDYSGDFGWGYDGVNWFAPCRLYGQPHDFRRFVDRAHHLGMAVILDVVYNHFGPDGNYIGRFTSDYFTDRYKNDWGAAINYDDKNNGPVREFVTTNAAYWIEEFHLDGLRLDATQNVDDASDSHILKDLVTAARKAGGKRSLVIVGENEPQEIRLVRKPDAGGYGIDALWNDDFHHTALVGLTGRSDAYFTDYKGSPQEFISCLKRGFLYQGQWYEWQKKCRGTPSLDVPPPQFITFLENHDQIANTGRGERSHQVSHPGKHRTLTALMLLGPGTPMLFQGQEFNATAPFFYFASLPPELAGLVADGRKKFLAQFKNLASEEMQAWIPDPSNRSTFEDCRLDWSERSKHHEALELHRDLIALRKSDPVLCRQSSNLDGAVLSHEAFVIRFFAEDGLDRLLLINLGQDLDLTPAPEPLLARPLGADWELVWCSESPRYGGDGVPPVYHDCQWTLPGNSATFLKAVRRTES